jgi:glutamyl-tRNA synthetase
MKQPDALKAELLEILRTDGVVAAPPTDDDREVFDGVFPVIRERLKLLNDVSPMVRFLFTDPGLGNLEDAVPKKMDAAETARVLTEARSILKDAPEPPSPGDEATCATWDEERESAFRSAAEAKEIKGGALLQPLRLAVTSSRVSPPLFPAIRLLGLDESIRRVDRLVDALNDASSTEG